MLSKEEIKNIKEIKDMLDYASGCVHSNLQLDNKLSKLLYSYIEQLETKNQKIIEKLEEILKEYEHVLASEESAINLYSEIKNIVKGEKE